MFRGGIQRRAEKPTRRLATLEFLEARLAPAVAANLFVQGTTLVYAGTDADNVTTITTPGTNEIQFSEAAGTISSSVPGFSGSGTTVSGTIPSYITSIAINGNNGDDVVNLGNSPTDNSAASDFVLLSRGLTVTAGTIVVNNSVETGAGPEGKNLTLNGLVSVQSADALDPVTIGANAPVIAGNVTINGTLSDPGTNQGLTIDASTGSAIPGNATVTGTTSLLGASMAFAVNGNAISLGSVVENPDATSSVAISGAGTVALHGDMMAGTGSGVTINANTAGTGSAGFTTTGNITADNAGISIVAGGSGNVTVQELDTTSVANAFLDTVTLQAGGSIIDGNGSGNVNVRSNVLDIAAGSTVNLDTEVSDLNSLSATGFAAGNSITIRNSQSALTAEQLSTVNGSISISNTAPIDVGGSPGFVTGPVVANGAGQSLTLTTTGAGSDISFFAVDPSAFGGGPSGAPLGSVMVDSDGAIVNGSGSSGSTIALSAPTMSLTAATNVGVGGTTSAPLTINTNTLSVAASGASAGDIDVFNGPVGTGAIPDLTLSRATSDSTTTGTVTIVAAGDLDVTGNVSTNGVDSNGNAITLLADSGIAPVLQEGTFQLNGAIISAPRGNLTLTAANTLQIDSSSKVTSGADVTLNGTGPSGSTVQMDLAGNITATAALEVVGAASNSPNVIDVSGNLSSGGNLTISGSTNDFDVFTVTGQLVAGGSVAVGSGAGDSAASTVLVSGTVTAAQSVVLRGSTTGSTAIRINAPATLSDGGAGALTLTGGTTGSTTFEIDGTLNGAGSGGIILKGSSSTGQSVITADGTIASSGAVAIDGGDGGGLLVTTAGPITGTTVTITGDTTAPNSFNIDGAVTATRATAGAVTITGGSQSDTFAIAGALVTGAGGHVVLAGGGGNDAFVITPQSSTPVSIEGGTGSSSFVVVNTPIANIVSTSTTAVIFQPATGFGAWTLTNIASVTPTVL